jgi:predicted nucleotidyltransferase component of viral defense system
LFAGLAAPKFYTLAREEVFAEKIHAYTKLRNRENTRVKDLYDMNLLIEQGLDKSKAYKALMAVFAIRKEHDLPSELAPPPESWLPEFEELARRAQVDISMSMAFNCVANFYKKAIAKYKQA